MESNPVPGFPNRLSYGKTHLRSIEWQRRDQRIKNRLSIGAVLNWCERVLRVGQQAEVGFVRELKKDYLEGESLQTFHEKVLKMTLPSGGKLQLVAAAFDSTLAGRYILASSLSNLRRGFETGATMPRLPCEMVFGEKGMASGFSVDVRPFVVSDWESAKLSLDPCPSCFPTLWWKIVTHRGLD